MLPKQRWFGDEICLLYRPYFTALIVRNTDSSYCVLQHVCWMLVVQIIELQYV
jgi:hypothetical protein